MLKIRNLSKRFASAEPVLSAIDLDVVAGETVCLLGPSGCGKTTLLRIVAGLETADSGTIEYAGRDLAAMAVHRRNFGLMFQEFALFPHRTVGQNIAFGLRMANWPAQQIERRLDEMLSLINLPAAYRDRSVFELSGGERQRVALARSLAPSPSLLMLDEPLGSLDRALRETLVGELRTILKQVGVTALYVTHDQEEAYMIADRIVVMQQGRVAQIDAPHRLYTRPAAPFVARFLGMSNLLPASIEMVGEELVLETALGRLDPAHFDLTGLIPGPATLLVRGQAAGFDAGPGKLCMVGRVENHLFRGDHYRFLFAIDNAGSEPLSLNLPTFDPRTRALVERLADDATVELALDQRLMMLLPP